LVEQRTENPRVTGSIPVLGIFGGKMALKGIISVFWCYFFVE